MDQRLGKRRSGNCPVLLRARRPSRLTFPMMACAQGHSPAGWLPVARPSRWVARPGAKMRVRFQSAKASDGGANNPSLAPPMPTRDGSKSEIQVERAELARHIVRCLSLSLSPPCRGAARPRPLYRLGECAKAWRLATRGWSGREPEGRATARLCDISRFRSKSAAGEWCQDTLGDWSLVPSGTSAGGMACSNTVHGLAMQESNVRLLLAQGRSFLPQRAEGQGWPPSPGKGLPANQRAPMAGRGAPLLLEGRL